MDKQDQKEGELQASGSGARREMLYIIEGGVSRGYERVPHSQVKAPRGMPVDSRMTMIPVKKEK